MGKSIEDIIEAMRSSQNNIRFAEAARVAARYFGEGRQRGSHMVYSMPWPGNPRVNLQNDKGKAKAYQIKQLLEAIDHLAAHEERK